MRAFCSFSSQGGAPFLKLKNNTYVCADFCSSDHHLTPTLAAFFARCMCVELNYNVNIQHFTCMGVHHINVYEINIVKSKWPRRKFLKWYICRVIIISCPTEATSKITSEALCYSQNHFYARNQQIPRCCVIENFVR